MRTMSGSPCLHYDCHNRNVFGYCNTTVCINERYQQEQWGVPSTTNKSENVVIKQQTNADRIRSMTDDELAEFIAYSTSCEACVVRKDGSDKCHNMNCLMAWLDWLEHEANNGD